ncbi:ADP-ribosylation [Coprinellus micaceus]|uniref:ADP-ribosylation n=1 Tax=Coprinellus micaceus TaxID=71717 RepID=A0A4Y7TKW9_COPMI|nr:ADP-ribosylation [Coprinellus micaceus]
MASHIPMALSFLSSVASGLQASGLGKPPNPAPSIAPPAPAHNSANTHSGGTTSGSTHAAQSSGTTAGSSNSTTAPTTALCIQCNAKPRYSDGTKTHNFCGKTCATANKAKQGSSIKTGSGTAPASSNKCDFCHNRPKYNDGTTTHDFCSKACAKNANPQRKQSGASGSSAQSSSAFRPITCQAPGCTNPPHPSSDYCSLAHKTMSENLCLMCLQAPKMANSHFCSQTCIDDAEKKGPMILEVPVGHSTFKSVAEQFKASWRHAGSTVYKIVMQPGKLAAYEAYRASVESKGQFMATRSSALRPTCSLCSIIRNSFDLSLFGKKTGWGRFGKGLYTSSTSSKSNDYSHNDCKSHLKAILLNKVVVGKGCKMLQDSTSLAAPPSGFDSVLAEKGGSLNYDELVVYNNDAIRPSFLVMYDEP